MISYFISITVKNNKNNIGKGFKLKLFHKFETLMDKIKKTYDLI